MVAELATMKVSLINPRPQRHEPPREEDEVETGSISGGARRPTTPIDDLRGFARGWCATRGSGEFERGQPEWLVRAAGLKCLVGCDIYIARIARHDIARH